MKGKSGVQVFNANGGPPPAAPQKPPAPMLFKYDEISSERPISIYDIRMPEEKPVIEFNIKWLESFKHFLTALWPQYPEHTPKPKNTPVKEEYLIFQDLKAWLSKTVDRALFPFVFANEKIEVLAKWIEIGAKALQTTVLKAVKTIAHPINTFVIPKIALFLERVEKRVDIVYRFIEKRAERLVEIAEKVVLRPLEKARHLVERAVHKAVEFASPILAPLQQIPEIIATASLWIWNTPPVQRAKGSIIGVARSVIKAISWGKNRAKELLEVPIKGAITAVNKGYDILVSLFDKILHWIKLALVKLYRFAKLVWSALNHYFHRIQGFYTKYGLYNRP